MNISKINFTGVIKTNGVSLNTKNIVSWRKDNHYINRVYIDTTDGRGYICKGINSSDKFTDLFLKADNENCVVEV